MDAYVLSRYTNLNPEKMTCITLKPHRSVELHPCLNGAAEYVGTSNNFNEAGLIALLDQCSRWPVRRFSGSNRMIAYYLGAAAQKDSSACSRAGHSSTGPCRQRAQPLQASGATSYRPVVGGTGR